MPSDGRALELAARAGEVLAISVVDVQKCCLVGEDDLAPIQQRLEEAVGRFRYAGIACSRHIRRVVNRSVSFGLLSAAAEFSAHARRRRRG